MKTFFKSLIVSILIFEAKLLLKRTKPTIIAVTGNVGKTSTKDAIYQVLKGKKRARKSEKSYNSEIGVPLSILGLENAWQSPWLWLKNIIDGLAHALFQRNYPEVLVLEMGVDCPGDMSKLTSWIKPDVVVLTRLPDVPVHVENFSSPAEVIAEKLTLVEALKSDGILIYNNDDEQVHKAAQATFQKSFGYGRYSKSDFNIKGDEVNYEQSIPTGIKFHISHGSDEAEFVAKDVLGVPVCYSLAAAAAVGYHFDISLEECANALADYVPPPGRMRIMKGIKDTLILDDTYNSSPTAAERAILTLSELKGVNRKIAVLGDMLELGRYSIESHAKIGHLAAEHVDLLVTVGVRSRNTATEAGNNGLDEAQILQYDDSVRAGRELQNIIQPGDVVLVKGSQGIRMEMVVRDIMAEPDKADKLLVRQSQAWQKR